MNRKLAFRQMLFLFCGILAGSLGYHFVAISLHSGTEKKATDAGAIDPQGGMGGNGPLYSDAEVEAMIRRWSDLTGGFGDEIEVVPIGTSAPLATVLGALGLKQPRLRYKKEHVANNAMHVLWQISQSYDLSYLTSIDDGDNRKLGRTDPRRMVYGVEIIKN